jgi:hypothetical protein
MSLIPLGFWGKRNYVTDGLKLYYDFASSSSYPGSGSTVFNLARNSFNGTIDGATFDGSDSGGCFSFDGANDVIKPSPLSFFNDELWGPNQTWEVWFKTTNTTNVMRLLGVTDTIIPTTFQGFLQLVLNSNLSGFQNGAINVHVRDNIGTTDWRERKASADYSTGFNNGNWHQLLATWENTDTYVSNANYTTQFRIYLDSIEISPYTLSAESTRNNDGIIYENLEYSPWIGAANSRGDIALPFTGKIGVVRAYSKGLTNDEVLLNFNQYKTRYGI